MFRYENLKNIGYDNYLSPAVYTYVTNDTLEQVVSNGYFSDRRARLQMGDIIHLNASDKQVTLKVLSSDTAEQTGVQVGWYDYNDLATVSAPINVNGGEGDVILTNDSLGVFTSSYYRVPGVFSVWDASNSQFDFSQLRLGDIVDIRIDIEVSSSNTFQFVDVDLELAYGTGQSYEIQFYKGQFKEVDAHDIVATQMITIANTLTLNNPAKLKINSDANCTVLVRGWMVRVTRF